MAKEPAENTSEFDLGDFVEGKKFANFEHDFKGIVEKIYEHSLLVLITENDPEDTATVNEYNHRAVVRMSETKILVKTDNPAPRKSDEEEEDDAGYDSDDDNAETDETPEGKIDADENAPYPWWDASTIYGATWGAFETVSWKGHNYQVKWWCCGQQPDLNCSQGDVWIDLGAY